MEANPNEKEKKASSNIFKDCRAEFSKITWPNRQELGKQTVSVIVICMMFFVIIFCMDFGLNKVVEILAGLVG